MNLNEQLAMTSRQKRLMMLTIPYIYRSRNARIIWSLNGFIR
jgi:hypothetical protein